MPPSTFPDSAIRQLNICNACRYCEGYCAVFPALERRTELRLVDIDYLANLCHDCGACLQACMYAPPHEFGVDIPATLRAAREETYVRYAWPQRAARLIWKRPRSVLGLVTTVAFASAVIAEIADGRNLTSSSGGPGAFYSIVPWLGMLIPGLAAGLFVIAVIGGAFTLFCRSILSSADGRPRNPARAVLGAMIDTLLLRYLSGGGPGCLSANDGPPSSGRRVLHQAVLAGFVLDLVSTGTAALYQDILGELPPYPLDSVPVILGTSGGVALIVGCTGLLWVSWRGRRTTLSGQGTTFTVTLNLVAITGIGLLVCRGTGAMGLLLDIHLATLAALFATLPYGKFVHGAYRFAALVTYRLEVDAVGELEG